VLGSITRGAGLEKQAAPVVEGNPELVQELVQLLQQEQQEPADEMALNADLTQQDTPAEEENATENSAGGHVEAAHTMGEASADDDIIDDIIGSVAKSEPTPLSEQ
jgi:hypothetical protein